MKTKLLLGAGAAVLTLTGISLNMQLSDDADVPFINPLVTAQSICGGGDKLAERRAYFVSAANAYATQSEPRLAETEVPNGQIGGIGYDITTANDKAQMLFDRGIAQMWNFNHGEAVNLFKAAQAEDPACGMCFWAEALALGPNINAPMNPEANAPAWAAIDKAMSLKSNASAKEKALINALRYRYSENPPEDRAKLDEAFAQQIADVAARYQDDDFIAVLAAEANMDMQAWDYWEADGRTPKGRTAKTISLLEGVLARNPDYQAAIHLYIHITENTHNPYRAEAFADKLAALSPGLGHLIHMPSHTYYKIGDFKKSLASNIVAVAADETFINNNDASIFYEYGYYTHNIHFVLTSGMMAGDREIALSMGEKLDAKLPLDMATAVPFVQPIKAAPMYVLAQFGALDKVMALEDPGAELPFLQAVRHYARGEALARAGRAGDARGEAEAIGGIINEGDLSGLENNGIPALDILNIARRVVIARAALVEEDYGTAIEALEEAVALQEKIAYTEPPYWYYPVKQTLAATLLKAGKTNRAEQLFVEALAENPNNGWVLYGLSKAYEAQGDKNAKKYALGLFKDAWAGDRKAINLDQL